MPYDYLALDFANVPPPRPPWDWPPMRVPFRWEWTPREQREQRPSPLEVIEQRMPKVELE